MESQDLTDTKLNTIDTANFFKNRNKKSRASLSLIKDELSDLPEIRGPHSTIDKRKEFRFQSQKSEMGLLPQDR